jgi:hypothetical protein
MSFFLKDEKGENHPVTGAENELISNIIKNLENKISGGKLEIKFDPDDYSQKINPGELTLGDLNIQKESVRLLRKKTPKITDHKLSQKEPSKKLEKKTTDNSNEKSSLFSPKPDNQKNPEKPKQETSVSTEKPKQSI